MKKTLAPAVFLASAGLCVWQALYYRAALPEKIASHFGADGLPNAWMSKGPFIGLNLGVVGLLVLVFGVVSLVMGALPASSINLPDKDYWLAPERRDETRSFLSGWFLWFASATMLLMLDVFHQVYRYNLFLTKALDHPLSSLAVYLAFTAAWAIGFRVRFVRK